MSTKSPSKKIVVAPCHHRSWMPVPMAPDLYEQCRHCGLKRYRDPAKRETQPRRVKQASSNQQLPLF